MCFTVAFSDNKQRQQLYPETALGAGYHVENFSDNGQGAICTWKAETANLSEWHSLSAKMTLRCIKETELCRVERNSSERKKKFTW